MEKEDNDDSCCMSGNKAVERCCKIESVISVDDRGQMVLPKEIRDRAKIHAGDKMAVVCWEKDGDVCCISLIKVTDLAEMVRDMLGPIMSEIFQK